MHKQRTTTELIHDLSLKLWEYHWKVKCEVKNCEICMLLEDAKEMNEPETAQQIQYQHSTKYCPCESCKMHRKWYCPTCDVLMSSPESTRCVNGHERRLAQKG